MYPILVFSAVSLRTANREERGEFYPGSLQGYWMPEFRAGEPYALPSNVDYTLEYLGVFGQSGSH